MNRESDIHWKLVELRRTQWLENEDPTMEQPLTFSAHTVLLCLLAAIETLLMGNLDRPFQSIKDFKINDKSHGEISLQWYGPLFELDLDISADGQISFLLCEPGSSKETWTSYTEASLEDVTSELEKYYARLQ